MSRRLILLIAILLIGLILILLILFLLARQRAPEPAPVNENLNVPAAPVAPPPLPAAVTPEDQEEARLQASIITVAKFFAERFGSYSNQSGLANITDLYPVMSAAMRQWAAGYIDELAAQIADRPGYFGVTTRQVSSRLTEFNDSQGRARVLVQTQRQEAQGTTDNFEIYYQDLLIDFVKENGTWVVNAASWQ